MYVFNFLNYMPKNGISGSYDNSKFKLVRNCQTIFKVTTPESKFLIAMCEVSKFSTSMPTLIYIFDYGHLRECEVVTHYNFDLNFLMFNDHLYISSDLASFQLLFLQIFFLSFSLSALSLLLLLCCILVSYIYLKICLCFLIFSLYSSDCIISVNLNSSSLAIGFCCFKYTILPL